MTIDLPGLTDPVHDSQAAFRALLAAMSEPGHIVTIGSGLTPPAPLDPATAAILLTLVDSDTPLWLDLAAEAAEPWLTFHCGAPQTAPEAASFAVALDLPDLRWFNVGTHESPERGATLIVQVPALGTGRAWQLSGPGLQSTAALRVTGLPDDFATQWAGNTDRYPRGIDLVLCAGQSAVALPRTVAVAAC
jgi:alpha-D-ribose 1-methylphosphonate 5-triphosphate synthase subunit PhnH